MRLVLDTNVVVSALLWGGMPQKILFAAVQGRVDLYTCDGLIAELLRVLQREKFAAQLARGCTSAPVLTARYRVLCTSVPLPTLIPRICRDPNDDIVLACADSANASVIVSGDKDLLALGTYKTVSIVHAAELVSRLAAGP